MYIPLHFEEVVASEVAGVVAAFPLACVVAQTSEGLIANHLPLLAGSDGHFIGHVALANDSQR